MTGLLDWLRRSPWPAVVVLLGVIAGAVAIYGLTPEGEERSRLLTALLAAGTLGGVIVRSLLGVPRDAAALLLAAGLGAATLTGCGGSAITTHATAATVLTVATAGASDTAVRAIESAAQACADEPCVDRVEEAGRVVTVAQEGLRLATLTYREAVEVAAAAAAGDDLLGALVVALARVVREWDRLVAVLHEALDVDLPPLPASVRGLVDALAAGDGS